MSLADLSRAAARPLRAPPPRALTHGTAQRRIARALPRRPVLAAAHRARACGIRPMQPRTPAPAPCAPARATLHGAAGVFSRRRSLGGRLSRLALGLACVAAALRVAAGKALSSLAIMKLNQIDPTVRRAMGRRRCARGCCARCWGLRGPTPAAARCASQCVPMGAARSFAAAHGARSALRRARSVGRKCVVRKIPVPALTCASGAPPRPFCARRRCATTAAWAHSTCIPPLTPRWPTCGSFTSRVRRACAAARPCAASPKSALRSPGAACAPPAAARQAATGATTRRRAASASG